MTLAMGAGKVIGGLAIPAPYTRIYAMAQPILVGATFPGGLDAIGQYLHFRYEGNLNLGSRSGGNQTTNSGAAFPLDFVQNKIVVEFDVQSSFTLPFEGHLYLVGGSGEWKYGIQVHDVIDKYFYKPEMRTLRTYCNAGVPFTIPDFHTFIMGVNTASQFTLPTGELLEPSINLPGANITAGTIIQPAKNGTVITGWLG